MKTSLRTHHKNYFTHLHKNIVLLIKNSQHNFSSFFFMFWGSVSLSQYVISKMIPFIIEILTKNSEFILHFYYKI